MQKDTKQTWGSEYTKRASIDVRCLPRGIFAKATEKAELKSGMLSMTFTTAVKEGRKVDMVIRETIG